MLTEIALHLVYDFFLECDHELRDLDGAVLRNLLFFQLLKGGDIIAHLCACSLLLLLFISVSL